MAQSNFTSRKIQMAWLTSFPRSGNTMLRTILFHCFGMRSASFYANDLANNKSLEEYVGHIEHNADGKIYFPANSMPLIKTHEKPADDRPAIYVIRDGRKACVSMYHFYKQEISLEALIAGNTRFGTWAAHLEAWRPWNRPDTLLLKYEDMVSDLPGSLQAISLFLDREIIADHIPEREHIAGVGGMHVRKKNAERQFPEKYLELFNQVNGKMMEKMGYYP